MKSIKEIAKQIEDGILKENTQTLSNTEEEGKIGVGDPNCPICHGIGYVRLDVPPGHPDFGKLYPCSCRAKELQQGRTQALREMSNLQALERFTFERFNPVGHGLDPERQENLRWAYERTRDFAQKPKGWLLLRGSYGCGKTHLAAAIANNCVERGLPVLFITVPDLLDHLRATFAPQSPTGYDQRFEQIRSAPLLILDDLGTENSTPWALEKLYQLLNYRYMTQLPTVITTNHEFEDLDPRLRSRLADTELMEIITILAPDFRRAGVEQAESDLNILSLYGDMTFETFNLRKGELDPEEVENLQGALETSRAYAANPAGWLVFSGDYGCGKTHLAAAIANARNRQGHPALFIVVPDLLDHLRATFSPKNAVPYDKRFNEVRRAPFLVMDDLGTESATPWAKEKLYQLFNFRYVARLPTIVTTAQAMEDMDPKLRTRILDVSRCTVVGIIAPPYLGGARRKNYRTQKRK